METAVVIVAAGRGTRAAGSDIPKQYRSLASNFNPGTGGVAPPPPAYYNPQLDNGTSNGVGLNCSTGLSQKTGTITVTQTPSLVTVIP